MPDDQYSYSGYSNAGATAALTAAYGAADPSRRAQLVIKAQALFEADAEWLPLVIEHERPFMANTITGAPPTMPCYLYFPWAAMIGARS
jgi:ABC-type transport system substrate-binding protein